MHIISDPDALSLVPSHWLCSWEAACVFIYSCPRLGRHFVVSRAHAHKYQLHNNHGWKKTLQMNDGWRCFLFLSNVTGWTRTLCRCERFWWCGSSLQHATLKKQKRNEKPGITVHCFFTQISIKPSQILNGFLECLVLLYSSTAHL